MAISFENAYGNTRLTELGQELSGGTLELQTSADVEVATLTLGSTGGSAFASIINKVGTYSNMTDDSDSTGGVVTKFVMKNNIGTSIYTGTVTAVGGGGDIEMDNVVVNAGVTVEDNITQPITFIEP